MNLPAVEEEVPVLVYSVERTHETMRRIVE